MDKSEENENVILYKNPKVEILFGFFGEEIPTKQDKYKPLKAIFENENGESIEVNSIYEKKEDKNTAKRMEAIVAEHAKRAFSKRGIIKKPAEVEVLLSFSIKKARRFNEIDIDNLSKTVLDGLVGVAFEDDVQVTSLIATKHIHPSKVDGVFIGVTELTSEQVGFGNEIKLFSDSQW